MWLQLLFVAIGGCLGAILRYVCSKWMKSQSQNCIPWKTLIPNLTACLALGFCSSYLLPTSNFTYLISTGFCGALSTFGTVIVEFQTLRKTNRKNAWGYVSGSLIGGVGILWLGRFLAHFF